MDGVHVAVTRQVKPGSEQEFKDALRDFARESLREPGTTGIHLIAPVPGTAGCEYGILRSFESEVASQQFYESELAWVVMPLLTKVFAGWLHDEKR